MIIRSRFRSGPFMGLEPPEFGRYGAEVEETKDGIAVRFFVVQMGGMIKPLGQDVITNAPMHVVLDKVEALVQEAETNHKFWMSGKSGARQI
jgi:hypothetical protein